LEHIKEFFHYWYWFHLSFDSGINPLLLLPGRLLFSNELKLWLVQNSEYHPLASAINHCMTFAKPCHS